MKKTLRCENEYIETLSEMLGDGAVLPDNLKNILRLLSRDTVDLGKLTSGKIGKCARDMVAECRRCSRVVCRVYKETMVLPVNVLSCAKTVS